MRIVTPKLLKITGTSLNKLKQLVIKGWGGAASTLTAEEYSPFGTDSRPPTGMIAVYLRTEVDGSEAIIGYLHRDRLAEVGEHRIYSTNADGTLQTYIWLKADGTILLGGTDNFAVKFNELKTEFNKLKTSFNDLVTLYNAHTHVTSCGAGAGSATAPPLISRGSANTSNIDNVKNAKIKTM
jgi:hypothetical protein